MPCQCDPQNEMGEGEEPASQPTQEQLPNECLIILASFHVAHCAEPSTPLPHPVRCSIINIFSLVSIRSSVVWRKFWLNANSEHREKVVIFLSVCASVMDLETILCPRSADGYIFCPFTIRCSRQNSPPHLTAAHTEQNYTILYSLSRVAPRSAVHSFEAMKRPANAEFSHACAPRLDDELSHIYRLSSIDSSVLCNANANGNCNVAHSMCS